MRTIFPARRSKDFSDFLAELDAGRPGGQVDVTQRKDRLAEVAELLGPISEAFPRLAAVLPPNLSRAVMTPVGSCLGEPVGSAIPRRCPRVPVHHLGCGEGQPVAPVPHGAGREQLAAIGWDRAKGS
jgi:hypothetical protein